MVMTATLDAVPLARLITEHAYKAGASLVTSLLTDEQSALYASATAPDASFDAAPSWLYEGMAAAYRSGAARLAIAGNDPSLLSKEDPEKVSRVNRATSKAYRPGAGADRAPRDQLDHRAPAPRPRGPPPYSPICRRTKRSRGSGKRSSPRRARISPIPSRHGRSTTQTCTRAPSASTRSAIPRCISADPAPISASASPTITCGWAAAPRRKTAATAFPICPPRKFSPRRTRIASRDASPAPSRCRIRAR